jgi:hypothetical protein
MTSVSLYNPLCSDCRKAMGEMTKDEFEFLVLSTGGMGKCFDCEPLRADVPPRFFQNLDEGELLDFSGLAMVVFGGLLEFESVVQSHAHERTRARGLSSSTKVNRSSHNRKAWLNGVEAEICPECKGDSVGWDDLWGLSCGTCNGQGLIASAIVIPKWIIEKGVTDA